MEKVIDVKSFLDKIEILDSKNNVFFRGHSNKDYILEPGIYRRDKTTNKSLIEFEDKIYREIISKAPQDFIGKNTLESLALMQHYEAPTRVLDLTENALVALYFACIGNDNFDGEIIVFDIPDDSICHYDSDRATILSNLAKCGKDFSYEGGMNKFHKQRIVFLESKRIRFTPDEVLENFDIEILDFFNENSEKIVEKYEDNLYGNSFNNILQFTLNDYKESKGELSEINFKYFNNFYIEHIQNYHRRLIDKIINVTNENYFGRLLHNIREDKSYFNAIIDPDDVSKVYAVRPKLNNPRIIKQSGAFLIFGVQETLFFKRDYKPMAILSEHWILRGSKSSDRIIVDKKAKNKIVKQLRGLGFDESTLFPEVDKVSHFVRNNFLEKLKK